MERLTLLIALHGVLILTIGALAGLFLWQSLVKKTNSEDWHLLHASGTSRGVMLIALAAIIHLPALPSWQITTVAWCIIYFVWSSVLAMLIRALTGEPGFSLAGSPANKVVHVLYVTGTITLFPGLLLLAAGLFKALAIQA
jgi:hypothetical protein